MKVLLTLDLLGKIDQVHKDFDHVIEVEMDFRPMVGDLIMLHNIIEVQCLENNLPGYVLDYIETIELFKVDDCYINFREIIDKTLETRKIESVLEVMLGEVDFDIDNGLDVFISEN